MISKTKAYTSSDGQVHATLEAAQRAELTAIFGVYLREAGGQEKIWPSEAIVNTIFANADKIKDVLTTRATSRPAARSVNGAARKGKPVKQAAEKFAKMREAVSSAA